MNDHKREVTTSLLNLSMNELARTLVLDLAMACRKLSIYSAGHPLGRSAVEKPFLVFKRIFGVKKYINFNTLRGQLYCCNICLKESVFSGQILQFMQVLDITALTFDRSLSQKDLILFLERFVARLRPDDPDYAMSAYLARQAVTTVDVNTELSFRLFETQRQYRGDVEDDFSVKRMTMEQLGSEPLTLAGINIASEEKLLEMGIDFDSAIVSYLLPERVASLPPKELRSAAEQLARTVKGRDSSTPERGYDIDLYMALIKLIQMHPERERILADLEDDKIRKESASSRRGTEVHSQTGQIRVTSANRMDALLEELFAAGNEVYEVSEFCSAFRRLLKTGQQAKAEDVISQLLQFLHDNNPTFRQKSLGLLEHAIEELNLVIDESVARQMISTVIANLETKRETYEYSELIWRLCMKCLAGKAYRQVADMSTAMARRRHFDNEVTVYDSMAVKKAFERINCREVIDRIIAELMTADFEQVSFLRQIMVAIGSEEAALALAQIVTHPVRQVRQNALKILGEMGKSSLKVFSRILMDDTWFERDPERQELPDNRWYTIRNSIFVLGLLKDRDGIVPLRLRITDDDIRVRREIVSALEKIGGEDAVDLLVLMSEDAAKEIRESAIGSIGLIGSSDTVPFLIDVARRNPSEVLRTVSVVGKLGGTEAKSYLKHLLEDEAELSNLAAGRVSKDDLRLAVIRGLGTIGDQESLAGIRMYQERLSTAHKILFKNSPVSKAISEILSRQ